MARMAFICSHCDFQCEEWIDRSGELHDGCPEKHGRLIKVPISEFDSLAVGQLSKRSLNLLLDMNSQQGQQAEDELRELLENFINKWENGT